jgi:hypothetical protein
MGAPGRLRVAVAAPPSEENCARVKELEPRIDVVVDQGLLPPMHRPGDFAGDPARRRPPARPVSPPNSSPPTPPGSSTDTTCPTG